MKEKQKQVRTGQGCTTVYSEEATLAHRTFRAAAGRGSGSVGESGLLATLGRHHSGRGLFIEFGRLRLLCCRIWEIRVSNGVARDNTGPEALISSNFRRLVSNALNKMEYRWNSSFIESDKEIGQSLRP